MISPLTVNPVTNKPWEYPVYPANYPCPFCLHALSEHGIWCTHKNTNSFKTCQCRLSAKKLSRGAKRWARKMNKLLAKQLGAKADELVYEHPSVIRQRTVDDLRRLESELKA
jgi:hypothetical protein